MRPSAHDAPYRDVTGLFTNAHMGGVAGAGLTMLFVPRVAAELGRRVTDSARNLGRAASKRHQQASTPVGVADPCAFTAPGRRDRPARRRAIRRMSRLDPGYGFTAKVETTRA